MIFQILLAIPLSYPIRHCKLYYKFLYVIKKTSLNLTMYFDLFRLPKRFSVSKITGLRRLKVLKAKATYFLFVVQARPTLIFGKSK